MTTEKVSLKVIAFLIVIKLLEFVDLYIQAYFSRIPDTPFSAFKDGYDSVLTGTIVHIFRPEELQELICGSPSLEFKDLEENAQYDGFEKNSIVIQYAFHAFHIPFYNSHYSFAGGSGKWFMAWTKRRKNSCFLSRLALTGSQSEVFPNYLLLLPRMEVTGNLSKDISEITLYLYACIIVIVSRQVTPAIMCSFSVNTHQKSVFKTVS